MTRDAWKALLHRLIVSAAALALLAGCAAGTPGAPTSVLALPSATPPGVAPVDADRLVVRVDPRLEQGSFDKGRLLNVTVGSDPARLHADWLPGAYDALLEAGIQRVRFDHITDDSFYRVVWRGKDGQLTYDFARLDALLLPLLERGIQPLLCLSYTPAVLSPDGSPQALPPLAEWRQVVSAIAGHYVQAGYAGLAWEVWSEPDLEQSLRADAGQYVALYQATAAALRAADPAARVGGPGDSAPGAPNGRLDALLAAAAASPDLPLDFITYHKTADANGDGLPPFDLEWGYDVIDFAVLRSQLPAREIYVTGWNLTGPAAAAAVGEGEALNDSSRAASEAAVMLFNALKYPGLSGVFYGPLLDGYHEAGPLHGGPGLLTVNYHRKAIFQLFQMISWLGDQRLAAEVSGSETRRAARYALATRGPGGQVAVLAWNNTAQPTTLDLAVDGLPASGNWQAARYQIDPQNAAYLSSLQAGQTGLALSPPEVLVPVETSTLPVTPYFERVTRLPAYSVVLFLLAPPTAELPGWAAPESPLRNYAAGKPVTISSSLEEPGWRAGAAVDELTLSLPGALGWSSAGVAQEQSLEWITVDLQQEVLVSQVVVWGRNDSRAGLATAGDGFPADFRIQGALQANQWVDLSIQSDYPAGDGPQVFDLEPGRYRYIRVMASRLGQIAGQPGEFYFQLAELQVFGE